MTDDDVARSSVEEIRGHLCGRGRGPGIRIDREARDELPQVTADRDGDLVDVRRPRAEEPWRSTKSTHEPVLDSHDLIPDPTRVTGSTDAVGSPAVDGQRKVGHSMALDLEQRIRRQLGGQPWVGVDPSQVEEERGRHLPLPEEGDERLVITIATVGAPARIEGERHPDRPIQTGDNPSDSGAPLLR